LLIEYLDSSVNMDGRGSYRDLLRIYQNGNYRLILIGSNGPKSYKNLLKNLRTMKK